jgi:hypothetical protein
MKVIARLFFAIALVCCAGLNAAETLTLRTATPVVLRPGHPTRLEVILTQDRPVLLEGRLRLAVVDGPATLLTWTSDAWVISGERRSTVLLPPVVGENNGLEVHATWISEDGTVRDLDPPTLLPAPAGVLGLCCEGPLPAILAPERLVPGEGRERTATINISADAAPTTALGWSVCDVVGLDEAVCARLSAASRSALITWVRGGGGLALFGPVPADFAAVVADPGLGRVLAATASEATSWRGAVAELWGLSTETRQQFIAGEAAWMPERPADSMYRHQQAAGEHRADLTRELWPQSMAQVPVGPVLGLFAVFVLMVGPGEWFLLGLIRRRRWTWITFPLTAAAATWATLAVAQHYLGNADHHRRLLITDRDAQGVALRTTTWDLHILGSGRTLTETPGDAAWMALDTRPPQGYRRGGDGVGTQVAWQVEGGRASVARQVSQWSPALSVHAGWGGNAAEQGTVVTITAKDGDVKGSGHSADWLRPLLDPPTALRANWTGTLRYALTTDSDGLILDRTWTFTAENPP